MSDGGSATGYEVLGRIATGGMAEIFLARHRSASGIGRYCVVKRIIERRARDPAFVEMFLDEARLAATLRHPNVVQVFDIGKLGHSHFFSMEYVHGETLRAIIRRARQLEAAIPVPVVLTTIAGAAAGLHHAHTRVGTDGKPLLIVHRDVSPSNLMVSYEGGVKVVDFGVAKAAPSTHETASGLVKGKVRYLSPEQVRGLALDRRSDLFSLGIVMWEMLTSERLYKRESDFESMQAIVSAPTRAPSTHRRDVPAAVDRIVCRLLEKDPDRRYQTADAVVESIEDAASASRILLSASVLSRFMESMFGSRAEPRRYRDGRYVSITTDSDVSDVMTGDGTSAPGTPSFGEDEQTAERSDGPRTDPRRFLTAELHVLGHTVAGTAPVRTTRGRTLLSLSPPPAIAHPRVAPLRVARGTLERLPAAPDVADVSLRPRRHLALLGVAAVALLLLLLLLLLRVGPSSPAQTRSPDQHRRTATSDEAPPPPTADASAEGHDASEPPLVLLQQAMDREAYREALAVCDVIVADPNLCAVAACRLADVEAARRFYREAPRSSRRDIKDACRAAGVELARTRRDAAD